MNKNDEIQEFLQNWFLTATDYIIVYTTNWSFHWVTIIKFYNRVHSISMQHCFFKNWFEWEYKTDFLRRTEFCH